MRTHRCLSSIAIAFVLAAPAFAQESAPLLPYPGFKSRFVYEISGGFPSIRQRLEVLESGPATLTLDDGNGERTIEEDLGPNRGARLKRIFEATRFDELLPRYFSPTPIADGLSYRISHLTGTW
ncbi:MAG: hypothetical protein HYR85_18555 [Planctomycetes bacterium]|nr:hypothetical protein [Planctomycetota bacterium]MBI3843383.1 hypothetical protein [Planctomycetota bacterium]